MNRLASPKARLNAWIIGAALLIGIFWSSHVGLVRAQSVNQSYDCGTYGYGAFGANDCVTPTVAETPLPNGPHGRMPVTGAQMALISVVGFVLLSVGAALYGWSRRAKRLHSP